MVPLLLSASEDAVLQIIACLGDGGIAAIPTETVYGLGADACNGAAIARLFEAKGRPRFNPLICHVADQAMAEGIAEFGPLAQKLGEAFWPGPLTMVLPAAGGSRVHPLVTAGLPSVAVRMPRGVALQIIAGLGRPVAAPSANRSGKVSPTTAAHVEQSLGGRVDLILDAGPAAVGIESTIVRPEDGRIVLLRAGGVTAAEIEAASGLAVMPPDLGAAIAAPGQLASHYAPEGSVRLGARNVEPGEWLVAFGPGTLPGWDTAAGVVNLSPAGDLREAAAQLFAALSALDRPDVHRIAVMPIPEHGLGAAINDRLRRAAAPRG